MKSQYCWSHFRNYGDFQTLWELPTFTFATWIIRSLNGLLPLLYRFVWTCDFFKIIISCIEWVYLYDFQSNVKTSSINIFHFRNKKWTFLSKKKLLTDQAISKAQKWTFLSKKKILTDQYYTKKKKTSKKPVADLKYIA